MSNPFRYLKLTQIEFGKFLTFSNDNVVSCNILEEIDLLSNEISINTCDFEIYNEDDKFNILNPQGVYSDLKIKLPVEIYSIDEDSKTNNLMGKFYLKTWKSKGNNMATFECEDYIGILGNLEYTRPKDTYNCVQDDESKRIYMKFNKFIEDVMGENLSEYYESYVIDDKGINGLLFKDKIKNVLQKGLFTFGVIADTSRSKKINFFKLENNEENLKTIGSDKIFLDSLEVTKISEYNEFIVYGYAYDESVSFDNKDSVKYFVPTGEGDLVSIEFEKPQAYQNIIYDENGNPLYINDISNLIEYRDFPKIKVTIME